MAGRRSSVHICRALDVYYSVLKSMFFMGLLTDLHAFRLRAEQSCATLRAAADGKHANLSASHQQLRAVAARVNKHLHTH